MKTAVEKFVLSMTSVFGVSGVYMVISCITEPAGKEQVYGAVALLVLFVVFLGLHHRIDAPEKRP